MLRTLRGASSRVVARVVGSRFAKPIARAAVATAGLLLLAFIGRTAVAGAMAASTPVAAVSAATMAPMSPALSAAVVPAPVSAGAPPPAELASPSAPVSTAGAAGTTRGSHTQATPDDPVFLNTATIEDLRRLPGIGDKRATSIVALRTRLGGRFHAVEDLLKVKGIGRTSLKRLRPLVRLDPPPLPDGGAAAAQVVPP
jgi:competence protein ComEA